MECLKLPIVVTLLQWNFWDIPQLVSDVIFLLKISVLGAKGITKNIPNLEVCDPTPAHSTTLFIKVVIVVLY